MPPAKSALISLPLLVSLLLGAQTPKAPAVFSPEGAGYSCALPARWVEGPSDAQSGRMLGPGAAAGYRPGISIRWHADEGGPARLPGQSAADEYVRRLRRPSLAEADKAFRATKPAKVSVAGAKGVRFAISRMRHFRALDSHKGKVPAPLDLTIKEEHVVLPLEKGFYTFLYSAAEQDFASGMPAFEQVLKTFRIR